MFQVPPVPAGEARYSDHDLEPLRAALLALSQGDFTQRADGAAPAAAAASASGDASEHDSMLGQIWPLVDAVATELSAFADEVTRVAREVGTEGRLGGQAHVRGVSGLWEDLTDSVNGMARNLTVQ